ncbi:MAG: amidophosphoribosyltransferase [Kiritimatiellae bacterium]|nr:amidophosphoribosyltransferase [Kiritimatiellia bacterium]
MCREMLDALKHECAVALVVLRRPPAAAADVGGIKLSLLLEKQHNRGQDGAGAAILSARPAPGEEPFWIAKSASATPLADVLGAIGKRKIPQRGAAADRIFLGHLRYATFGKNDVAYCHPFVHAASDLAHTLLLAGNFNLTNAAELFEAYRRAGAFPTSRADGYLICELIAKALGGPTSVSAAAGTEPGPPVADALANALKNADGAWTLCGATGDGWAFATRDPHGIRPCFYYIDDAVVAVASERPAIQAAFDQPPEAVKELPPGTALIVSPDGEIAFYPLSTLNSPLSTSPSPHLTLHSQLSTLNSFRSCVFERIYFSRANDADIHRERKALGAALLPRIRTAAGAPLADIFFSYIPNSARIAFHGLLEELFRRRADPLPRFGEVIVKDAKFRTFIADAAARREFYKHIYDVTYGLVRPQKDTLVVLDDSIVRGNTMKNAVLPMLDRLGPKRIVIASSAPPIRYPDCYGIDMSSLGELVAFRALVNLLGNDAEKDLTRALNVFQSSVTGSAGDRPPHPLKANPLAALYDRFTDEEQAAEIARLLTPPGMKAEVKVVFQTIDALHAACPGSRGDWYFTGDYPTPGGPKVLRQALANYLERRIGRSY